MRDAQLGSRPLWTPRLCRFGIKHQHFVMILTLYNVRTRSSSDASTLNVRPPCPPRASLPPKLFRPVNLDRDLNEQWDGQSHSGQMSGIVNALIGIWMSKSRIWMPKSRIWMPKFRIGMSKSRIWHPNPRFGRPNPGFGRPIPDLDFKSRIWTPNPGFGHPNPGFGHQIPDLGIQILDLDVQITDNPTQWDCGRAVVGLCGLTIPPHLEPWLPCTRVISPSRELSRTFIHISNTWYICV